MFYNNIVFYLPCLIFHFPHFPPFLCYSSVIFPLNTLLLFMAFSFYHLLLLFVSWIFQLYFIIIVICHCNNKNIKYLAFPTFFSFTLYTCSFSLLFLFSLASYEKENFSIFHTKRKILIKSGRKVVCFLFHSFFFVNSRMN